MRRAQLVFDVGAARVVRHVRARDLAHATEQGERIEEVLGDFGFTVRQALLAERPEKSGS